MMRLEQKAGLAAALYIDEIMDDAKLNKKWQVRQMLEMLYLRGAIDALERHLENGEKS